MGTLCVTPLMSVSTPRTLSATSPQTARGPGAWGESPPPSANATPSSAGFLVIHEREADAAGVWAGDEDAASSGLPLEGVEVDAFDVFLAER